MVLVVLFLAACSSGSTDSGGSGGDGQRKVTLVWWNNGNEEPAKSFYRRVVQEYEAAHPKVHIQQSAFGSEDLKARLQVAMLSPTPPDVIQQWGGGFMSAQVKAHKLMDLTDDTKDVVPHLVGNAGWQYKGRVYGLNFEHGVIGFWYRKDVFARAGITRTPTTLEQLLHDVGTLRAQGIEPVALGGKDKWPTSYWYDYLALRECSSEALTQAVAALDFRDPCWLTAAHDFQKVIAAKPFAQGYLGRSAQKGSGSSAGQIANGKAAMELMGEWDNSVIQGLTPDHKPLPPTVLGWFPFPAVTGAGGSSDAALGRGDGYSCSIKAPKECVDFIKYFTSTDVQRRYAQVVGRIPANRDAASAIQDVNLRAVAEAPDRVTFTQLTFDVALGSDVGDALSDAVALQLTGANGPNDVVSALRGASK